MASSRNYSWKVLATGKGAENEAKIEEHLHSLGYKNSKVVGIDNDKASDDRLLKVIQDNDWDAISIGGAVNGYDDHFPKEVTTLHWFNRLVNLVHEHAPKAKFIFVPGPDDIADSIDRVLGSQEKQPETV